MLKYIVVMVLIAFFCVSQGHAQDVVLGEYDTKFSTRGDSADRAHNVLRAAELINGTVLKPGETFSYNTTIGKRTKEHGFREAHVIVDGKLVDGMGGGVCQVSSTLHAAALLAGLQIDEHHVHSRSSLYIQPALDATVDFGRFDFRFTNTYPFDITLRVDTTKLGLLNVRILGLRKTKDVFVGVKITNKHEPKTHTYHVKYLPAGKRKKIEPGTLGCDAELIRTIKNHLNNTTMTEVLKVHYTKTDRIVHVGKSAHEREFPLVDPHQEMINSIQDR